MKRYSILTIIFFLVKLSNAQTSLQFSKHYGGSKDDICTVTKKANDGDYVMAGYSFSNDSNVTDHHGTVGTCDIWVVKVDPQGNIKWKKSIGGSGSDIPYDIIQRTTIDSSFIICGSTSSNDGDFLNQSKGGTDMALISITKTGYLNWTGTYGGTGTDIAYSVVEMPDKGFAIAGSTTSNNSTSDFGIWNQGSQTGLSVPIVFKIALNLQQYYSIYWQNFGAGGLNASSAFKDIVLLSDTAIIVGGYSHVNTVKTDVDFYFKKIDKYGFSLWTKNYGSSVSDQLNKMKLLSDGSIIAVGVTSGNDGDVSGNHGKTDALVIKINSNTGNKIWLKCYGGWNDEYASCITQLPDGSCTLGVNSTSYPVAINGDWTTFAGGTFDMVLFNFDPNTGNKNWAKNYGSPVGADYITSVIFNSPSEYIIGGYSNSNYSADIPMTYGAYDYSLLSLKDLALPVTLSNFSGNKITNGIVLNWNILNAINFSHFNVLRSFDGNNFELVKNVKYNNNSNYNFIDNINYSKVYYKLEMVDKDGSKTISNVLYFENKISGIKIYPNPVRDIINIEFPSSQVGKKTIITIYDYSGKQVYKKSTIVESIISINIRQLSNMHVGTYIITVLDETSHKESKKIFIR